MVKREERFERPAHQPTQHPHSDELFFLKERLDLMDKRIHSIHRWVIVQRVYFWIKFVIFILAITGLISVYNTYAPMAREKMDEINKQAESIMNMFSSIGGKTSFRFDGNDQK